MDTIPQAGVFLLHKPPGPTSHDMVALVRKKTGIKRVGHAGTLDPFATGLLILGVDQATKKLAMLVGMDKEYEATLLLGATSTTFDPEGIITPTARSSYSIPDATSLSPVLDLFRGGYDQRAPIFSAKKINGKKLYDLARAGKATEEMRPVKRIIISKLHIKQYAFPFLSLTVACSSGTYIRSLADDIGRELGCGAYLATLRRTRIGTFCIKDAHTLAELPISSHSRTLDNISGK